MSRNKTTKKTNTRSAAKSPEKKSTASKNVAKRASRADSKQSIVIAQLNQPAGTTINAIMKATGWQQHSVRGFLAGVVRKRLKLNLSSQKADGSRVYRIIGTDDAKAVRPRSKRLAA